MIELRLTYNEETGKYRCEYINSYTNVHNISSYMDEAEFVEKLYNTLGWVLKK